jgi:hypothetical protein
MAATISKDLVSRNITTSCIRFFLSPKDTSWSRMQILIYRWARDRFAVRSQPRKRKTPISAIKTETVFNLRGEK